MSKRYLSIVAALVLGLSSQAYAWKTLNTPTNQRGQEANPLYGGYDSTRIATTSEYVVCSGKCLLAGLIFSTGPTTSRAYVFDTAIAGSTSARRLAAIPFAPAATEAAKERVEKPIRFYNGISVDLSSVSAGEEVEVLYLKVE